MKRITILAGHYGSGKSHLAVALALRARREHDRVALCDLDIVNPYFRTRDAIGLLRDGGVELIVSDFAGSNVDLPSVSPLVNRIFDEPGLWSVVDVGGDDRGALALGRFAPRLANEDYDLWLVVNRYRPLTGDADDTLGIMREIEAACKLRFTGLVNNSNLGAQTTPEDIERSLPYAGELSSATGLPLVLTGIREDLLGRCTPPHPLPVTIFNRPGWDI